MYTFQCPLCEPEVGLFERNTADALDIAIASHILRHNDEACLRAVDRARLGCQEIKCSLGHNRVYDPLTKLSMSRLTEFDQLFLTGMKIRIE